MTTYKPKYKTMFQTITRTSNPCILIYHYVGETYYRYGRDGDEHLEKFVLPRNMTKIVGDICQQCQIFLDEDKSFDEIEEYINARVEYFEL